MSDDKGKCTVRHNLESTGNWHIQLVLSAPGHIDEIIMDLPLSEYNKKLVSFFQKAYNSCFPHTRYFDRGSAREQVPLE